MLLFLHLEALLIGHSQVLKGGKVPLLDIIDNFAVVVLGLFELPLGLSEAFLQITQCLLLGLQRSQCLLIGLVLLCKLALQIYCVFF